MAYFGVSNLIKDNKKSSVAVMLFGINDALCIQLNALCVALEEVIPAAQHLQGQVVRLRLQL